MDSLVGTPALKPYMHGYFLKLKLYDAARAISNPFAYEEYREKMVREKMDKMAESRIRTRKDVGVKVNKALAEKIQKEAERERKRQARKKDRAVAKDGTEGGDDDADTSHLEAATEKPSLLSDPRFKKLFEDPEFAVDEDSREYALMNPSAVAQRQNRKDGKVVREQRRTAVEEEEDESDKISSDGLESSSSDSGSDEVDESDSSEAGGRYFIFLMGCGSLKALFRPRTQQVRPSCSSWTKEPSCPRGVRTKAGAEPPCESQSYTCGCPDGFR